ncbi:MAG TPA: carboxy terminal-processing peptidase [Pirellulales bacterium]
MSRPNIIARRSSVWGKSLAGLSLATLAVAAVIVGSVGLSRATAPNDDVDTTLIAPAPAKQGRVDLTGPTDDDRRIALAVSQLMRSQHMSKRPLDDEISKRFLDRFLKTLDPMKVYFVQSDIDRFKEHQLELDDTIRRGDVSFAYEVFNQFLKRVDERVKWVDEILKQKQDFTIDEELLLDPEKGNYAKDETEARDLWRKKMKYELLLLKADKEAKAKKAAEGPKSDEPPVKEKAPEDPIVKLSKRQHGIARRWHQIDDKDLLEIYLSSLTTAFDPHSSYMSPKTLENFEIDMRLQLDGIGAALSSGDDGYVTVQKVVPGGAADKDGRLKVEDRVTGVGQNTDGPIEDVVDMKLSDVVSKIRGRRGTTVRLEVMPEGTTERKIYNIMRDEIKLTDSEARGRIIEKQFGSQTFKIGVIDLPSFYMDMDGARQGLPDFKSTTRDVRRLLDDFKAKGVQAVVLDLRKNGGGSLPEAESLTGLFIDQGPVVQIKDSDGHVAQHDDPEQGMAWSGPLVVLISKLSASASEIFAGAIQDYERGLIVGDHSTHGKGSVQSLMDLSRQLLRGIPHPEPMGALKITMQQFYRPHGESTQHRGVVADVELPSMSTEWPVGESDLDYPLEFDTVPEAPYRRLHQVDRDLSAQLSKLSAERRKQMPEFQALERRIARYKEQKTRKGITLNEKKFLAERAEFNADKEQEKELDELDTPSKEIFDPNNYYNRVALSVLLDYLKLTKVAKTN